MQPEIVYTHQKYIAHQIAPAAIEWLGKQKEANVFQVFDKSCNLIDSSGSIVSLVSTELGPGPFVITVSRTNSPFDGPAGLWEGITVSSKVNLSTRLVKIASVNVDLSKVELWNPRPTWGIINSRKLVDVYHILSRSITLDYRPPNSFIPGKGKQNWEYASRMKNAWSKLSAGLINNNLGLAKKGAKSMAGLGSGLTPAGDDFLLGLIYSLWSTWDAKRAQTWAKDLVMVAIPLTTRLSAAWLKAAANGEAVEPWHDLVNATVRENPVKLLKAASRILATGHSSGTDALTGYVAGLYALTGEYRYDSDNWRSR